MNLAAWALNNRVTVLGLTVVMLVGGSQAYGGRARLVDRDFTINDGVVATRAFLIDTDDYTVTGEGTVDLGQETVDYVMLPKKKSRVVVKAEPVKITGKLSDPDISALPIKSAAATYGSLIFGPVVFAGVFASQEILGRLNKKRSEGKETPCEKYKDAYEAMLASEQAPEQEKPPQNDHAAEP